MQLDARAIVDALTDDVGEGLRSVAEYDNNGYELYYIRDDLEETYSAEEIQRVYEQIDVEGLGYYTLQKVFKAGDLECATYTFEDGRMFHLPIGDFSGLFVSIDRSTAIDHDAVIDRCLTAIERSR